MRRPGRFDAKRRSPFFSDDAHIEGHHPAYIMKEINVNSNICTLFLLFLKLYRFSQKVDHLIHGVKRCHGNGYRTRADLALLQQRRKVAYVLSETSFQRESLSLNARFCPDDEAKVSFKETKSKV